MWLKRVSMTHRVMALAAAAVAMLGTGAATAADSPKTEEVPFWAVGKPKSEAGAKLAPVPSFPIATPADQLPVKKLKVPPGFKVEVWASNILDARGLRQGDKGTVFVSSLFVAGKIYAVTDNGGTREVKTIADSYPGFDVIAFNAMVAPAGVPAPVLSKLSADIRAVVNSAEFAEKVRNLGIFPLGNTPQELDAWMRDQITRWAEIAKAANIKAD